MSSLIGALILVIAKCLEESFIPESRCCMLPLKKMPAHIHYMHTHTHTPLTTLLFVKCIERCFLNLKKCSLNLLQKLCQQSHYLMSSIFQSLQTMFLSWKTELPVPWTWWRGSCCIVGFEPAGLLEIRHHCSVEDWWRRRKWGWGCVHCCDCVCIPVPVKVGVSGDGVAGWVFKEVFCFCF